MERFELINLHMMEHHAKSILYGLASKLVKLLLFLSPLIFLFYLNGVNFYALLGVFLIVLVLLWLGYVRAYNYKRIHFYVYTLLKQDKDKEFQSMFRL